MLSGVTLRAAEIAGTAVFRIVVSSDSMKNATATSQGNSRLLAGESCGAGAKEGSGALIGGEPGRAAYCTSPMGRIQMLRKRVGLW